MRPSVTATTNASLGHLEQARAFADTGDWAAAEQACRRALNAVPDQREALALQARALVELGRWEEALAVLGPGPESDLGPTAEQSAEQPPDGVSERIAQARAEALLGMGRGAEALALLDGLLRECPDSAAGHRLRALALLREHQHDAAEQAATRALKLVPEDARALGTLGLVKAMRGQPKDAERLLRAALDRQPELPEALANLAPLLVKQGRKDEALHLLTQALAKKPFLPGARKLRAKLLVDGGDLAAALADLEHLLALDPDNAEAARIAAAVRKRQAGSSAAEHARTAAEQSLTQDPWDASAWLSLAAAQRQLGEYKAAEEAAKRAVDLAPADPSALHELGRILRLRGDLNGACAALQRAEAAAPALAPADVELLADLAESLSAADRSDACHRVLDRWLTLAPTDARAHTNKGLLWQAAGRYEAAAACHQQAVALEPDLPGAHYNLGEAFGKLGRVDAAITSLERAVELAPGLTQAWAALGRLLFETGRYAQAEALLNKLIRRYPLQSAPYHNLGVTLMEQRRHGEALAAFRKAVELDPDSYKARLGLARLHVKGFRLAEAEAQCVKAAALAPAKVEVLTNLGSVRATQGLFELAFAAYDRALQINPDFLPVWSHKLLYLNYGQPGGVQAVAEAHLAFGRQCEHAFPPRALPQRPGGVRRRLRVGYVSEDYRAHSCAYFIEPLLRAHDREAVEVFCYSDVSAPDAVTERLKPLADHWCDARVLDDERLAQRIGADGIDILVDLNGHTGNNRVPVFASRAAPVQVSWLGYPNTTGLRTMDYRLTDPWADPPGRTESLHSETLMRLPGGFLCYAPHPDSPPVGPLPANEHGYVTFGCFNNSAKLSAPVIALWARILRALPNARLLLKARQFQDDATRRRYQERFALHGIGERQLELRQPQRGMLDHLAQFNEIDIALDPFPYNGTTTTCEALWMGVPVIALAGEVHAARVGVSLLEMVGLPDGIAATEDDYLQRAIDWASDLGRLAAWRTELRGRMADSALCDGARFAGEVEAAYREMWRTWLSSQQHAPARRRQQAIAEVNAGMAALGRGELDEAEASLRQATETDPDLVAAHLNLGVCLKKRDKLPEAAQAYRRALELNPNLATGHSNLAATLCQLGQVDAAEQAARRAIELDPGFRSAYAHLALVEATRYRFEQAVACYEKALEIGPPTAAIYNDLAVSAYELGHLERAEAACRQAIAMEPTLAAAYANLATVHTRQGRADEAVAAYRKAANLDPALGVNDSNLLLALHYDSRVSAVELAQAHRDWGARHADRQRYRHPSPRPPRERLRIGYVSGDFRAHSVAFFFEPLLAAHDRQRVETFCYANVRHPDSFTRRLEAAADHWRSIVGREIDEVAEMIQADRIDILVDLSGHTSNHRLPLFALKPAPLQLSWLGYPNTTGLPQIDYRISDAAAEPEGEADRLSTERILRLPEGFHCYLPPGNAPEVGPLPAAANGYVTFASFNNLAKINPEVIALWARVLSAVPNARLLLKSVALADGPTRARYQGLFADHGIGAERLELLSRTPHLKDHLAVYHQVDIALDPFPYNGTTTTCEALWMGVPVLSLVGDRHAARVGLSLLRQVGLERLAVPSPDAYVAQAGALAGDLQQLAALRRELRDVMRQSTLCDGPRFAREIEAAYFRIWHGTGTEDARTSREESE